MALDSDSAGGIAVALAGIVLLLVGAAVVGVLAFDRPRVAGVDNDWGEVTENRTEIETQIAVKNPRLLELADGVTNVRYTVSLNDVRIADDRVERVDVSGDRDAISTTTWANNDKIPEWWASHINRNETTTVRVNPTVVTEAVGLTFPAKAQTRTRTVRTNMLEPLQSERTRTLDAFGRTLLIVNETSAHWGNATAERTPLNASATITNPTSVPIPVVDIGYTIRMNGVRVGHSTADQRTVIPPHSTRTVRTRAIIDNSKLDQWWVTHVRNNETTNMTVDFHATVEFMGQQRRIPLDFLTFERTFETDIFGESDSIGANSSTAGNASAADPPARRPVSAAA